MTNRELVDSLERHIARTNELLRLAHIRGVAAPVEVLHQFGKPVDLYQVRMIGEPLLVKQVRP